MRTRHLAALWRAAATALLVALLGACAAPSTSRPSDKSEIARPAKPARIASDAERGFTITEAVRIPAKVRNAYAAAQERLAHGDLEGGIAGLEEVVALAPELTAPHIDLGIAFTARGDFDRAEASLKHALALTPDHPVAHNELGIVYRKTGRFELARQSYEEALRVLSDFHYAQRNLGVLCDLFLQDLQCALSNYEAYGRAFPDDREVQMWIDDIRMRLGAS